MRSRILVICSSSWLFALSRTAIAGGGEGNCQRKSVLYSTLSPCDMCSGTALFYRIPKIVIGENRTFRGPEDYTRSRGIELVVVDSDECHQLMQDFIKASPQLWNEGIGEV